MFCITPSSKMYNCINPKDSPETAESVCQLLNVPRSPLPRGVKVLNEVFGEGEAGARLVRAPGAGEPRAVPPVTRQDVGPHRPRPAPRRVPTLGAPVEGLPPVPSAPVPNAFVEHHAKPRPKSNTFY
jgi:hypothetical protein